MSMKNANETIGNQTRDLPVCSAVSQPTAPPCATLIQIFLFAPLQLRSQKNKLLLGAKSIQGAFSPLAATPPPPSYAHANYYACKIQLIC
jgi:hypothetical protein